MQELPTSELEPLVRVCLSRSSLLPNGTGYTSRAETDLRERIRRLKQEPYTTALKIELRALAVYLSKRMKAPRVALQLLNMGKSPARAQENRQDGFELHSSSSSR
jgi:hypothetical protein